MYKHVLNPSRILVAPHPAVFHHSPDVTQALSPDNFHPQRRQGSAPPPGPQLYEHSWERHPGISSSQQKLVTALGTVRKADKTATRIRAQLETQMHRCQRRHSHDTAAIGSCHHVNFPKNTYRRFQARAVVQYMSSTFCLCAPGDLEIRRALFDILLSGCIPVTFANSKLVLSSSYPNLIVPDFILLSSHRTIDLRMVLMVLTLTILTLTISLFTSLSVGYGRMCTTAFFTQARWMNTCNTLLPMDSFLGM